MFSLRQSLSALLVSASVGLVSPGTASAAEEVNVYTHRHYEADDALYAKFTEATGIKVNIVKAKADALLERLKAEGEGSPADVLITADAGRLERAKSAGVLQPVESAALTAAVPANLRDEEGCWYGFTVRARVLVYAKDRVEPAELGRYEDLADPKWKGRVLARSSSNIYNQSLLASIIAADGEKAALGWARAVRGNMARAPEGSDRDQMRAVAAGIGDVAIVNTYYVGLLANSSDPKDREVASKLGVFFPNQDGRGTHINASGGGVAKHSKNKANAIKLLEFLTGEAAQATFPETTYEYPLHIADTRSELLKSWGPFKADPVALGKLGQNNSAAVKIFALAGWK